jgi:hypothetical protein
VTEVRIPIRYCPYFSNKNVQKMKLLPIFTSILFLSLIQSGCCSKKPVVDGQNCSHTGTVKDFTGLDGCRLLIITEEGKKLLPASISDENFELKAGQKIRFDYKESDGMSICMAEDMIVEITCIELVSDEGKETVNCPPVTSPFITDWMRKAIEAYKPVQIVQYPFGSGSFVYLFKGDNVYLFDCNTKLICESPGKSTDKCMQLINPGTQRGRILYQGEGVKD